MKITYLNTTLNKVVEDYVVAEGTVAYYSFNNGLLKAIPKEEIVSKFITKEDYQKPLYSVFSFIRDYGFAIRNIDLSLLEDEHVN